MMNELLSALGTFGNVIDTPGSVARGLLAGDTDAAFGGILDPSKRISGRGLLENWDMVNRKQEGDGFDFGDVLGMGADIATNPLTYIPVGGLAARAIRGAGQAAESAATGGMSGLLNARRSFSMAKDVVPGKTPTPDQLRLVGGGLAEKLQAAGPVSDKLKERAIEQLKNPGSGLTQAIFDPGSNAGAVLKTAEPYAARHEVVHGLVNNAYQTGEMAGLPLPVKAAAKLLRLGGGAEKGFFPGAGYAADELAAHALENRGLLNQLRGAGRFLFSPGANHDFYAREFADVSPLVGALYGQLPNVPRYAGYAGLGAGLGAGGAGALAYANQ